MSTHLIIPQFDITDRLRKAREQAGMSQGDIAEAMGVARSTVSNYEAGATTNHRTIVLRAWAEATNVPVEWLRWGTDPNGPGTPSDQADDQSCCTSLTDAEVLTFPKAKPTDRRKVA